MTPQEWLHQGLHDDKDVPILNNVRKSLVKMLEDVKDISTKYCKKSELISGALNESFKKNGHVVKCFLFLFFAEKSSAKSTPATGECIIKELMMKCADYFPFPAMNRDQI